MKKRKRKKEKEEEGGFGPFIALLKFWKVTIV